MVEISPEQSVFVAKLRDCFGSQQALDIVDLGIGVHHICLNSYPSSHYLYNKDNTKEQRGYLDPVALVVPAPILLNAGGFVLID